MFRKSGKIYDINQRTFIETFRNLVSINMPTTMNLRSSKMKKQAPKKKTPAAMYKVWHYVCMLRESRA